MKNRIAFYVKPNEDQEKILKFKNGDEKEKVSCLNKKYFDKKNDKDKIKGYVHLKNKEYSGKEYGTLENAVKDSMDIYSKKKFYQGIVGYIPTEDEEYLAVTRNYLSIFILLLAALAAVIVLCCWLNFRDTGSEVLPPDFDQVVDEEDDDCNCDITAQVTLPDGDVSFDGEIDIPEDELKKAEEDSSDQSSVEIGTGEDSQDNTPAEGDETDDGGKTDEDDNGYTPYTGKATIKVTMLIDEVEHIMVDTTEVNIENGEIPDVYIDFTKLDFELQPGIYYGYVYITYEDGSTLVKPIRIVILDTENGQVGIGYSNEVYVYKSEDRISLKYACQDSTTRTIIQVIVKSGDDEILLAQSGIINSGDTIKELSLDSSVKSKLQTGSYQGVLRVYFDDTGLENVQTADLKTDIAVTINVQ